MKYGICAVEAEEYGFRHDNVLTSWYTEGMDSDMTIGLGENMTKLNFCCLSWSLTLGSYKNNKCQRQRQRQRQRTIL